MRFAPKVAMVAMTWVFSVFHNLPFHAFTTTTGRLLAASVEEPPVNVRGRVVDSSTGGGIFKATVSIQTLGGTSRQVVETDLTGSFYVTQMNAGAYQITAMHGDYSPGGYGQLWPGGPLRPLRIVPSTSSQDVTIRLSRPAAIDGMLTTQDGQALEGANVFLLLQTSVAAPRTPAVLLNTTTNNHGAYHFTGVPPGKYVLGTNQSYRTICSPSRAGPSCVLAPREHSLKPVTTTQSARPRVYESVFYPDATELSDAETIWLHPGQNSHGMDLRVPLVEGVDIRGDIDSTNGHLANVDVRVGRSGNIGLETLDLAAALGTTDESGHFAVLGVPPGPQAILVEHRTVKVQGPTLIRGPHGPVLSGSITVEPVSDETPLLTARSDVLLGDENITDYRLILRRGSSLKGVVRFNGERKPPDTNTMITRSAIVRATDHSIPSMRAQLNASGQFYFPSLMPGAYVLSIDSIPGWFVASMEIGGKPIGENAIDLRYQSVENVEIHLTDHAAAIDGVVVRKDAEGVPNATVFLFASRTMSPRAKVSVEDAMILNVSDTGQFSTGPLKPGDYFLTAVKDGWFDLDWREQEVLQILAKRAARIRVVDRPVGAITLIAETMR